MKEIIIKSKTYGIKKVKVDDDDYDEINKYKWNLSVSKNNMYAKRWSPVVNGKRSIIYMARQIMGVTERNIDVDHKNHDGLNNQKHNLRICTQKENSRNRLPIKERTSKFLGVSKSNQSNGKGQKYTYWRMSIRIDGRYYTENFPYTLRGQMSAARRYDELSKKHYGEFANLNFKFDMISTLLIKQQQLSAGFFKIGSGVKKILIMGSCRVLPYVNYLNEFNSENGNPFTIYSIDPFNFNWNANDERVDYSSVLKEQESNTDLLEMLKSVDVFIHEYYQNSGMFNVFKGTSEKTIYDFGMSPEIDVCIPNFNSLFILTADIVSFDMEIRQMAFQDYNVIGKLSEQTLQKINEVSEKNIQKFYDVCAMSDVPEMADYFRDNFKKERLFWTNNHVAKGFTLAIFKFINDKFLHLDLSKGFNPDHEDMFANNYVHLSEYDKGFEYNEEVVPLISKLFF